MSDITTELSRCGRALIDAPDRVSLYRQVDASVKALCGHRLFTLLTVVDGGQEVERIYTSDAKAYPLAGRKPMGPTPWGKHVIEGRQAWHGRTMADIRWAFPDHALIESLGCGSCINIPVIAFGRLLGTMNVLDQAEAYDARTVEMLSLFAPVLALPFSQET
jgi:GAF domain